MINRRAKIVATIGPASRSPEMLARLIQAGIDIARLNFSHGSHADHAEAVLRLRQASRETGRIVTILQDLQGPKMRTGALAGEGIQLSPGQRLTLTTRPIIGSQEIVAVDFPELPRSVRPGGRILLDDGNLELAVVSASGDQVETRVIVGGTLKARKGINLPGAPLEIPGFTPKDEADLIFGLAQGVDAVAISFVRSPRDVLLVRQAIHQAGADVPVIAKLERPEALDNLEEIVQCADGVMVARGDLGVEMSPQAVPIAQKRIIASANQQGKLVITATQMLDSMIHNPRPTRAEASDVANAIFDGSDAVMLSGETASGNYPLQAVETMDAIVQQAEKHMGQWSRWQGSQSARDSKEDAYFITLAARELAHDRNVAAIAVFTQSGRSALLMSKARPHVPILAFSPHEQVCRRMALYWGVTPHHVPHADSIEDMLCVVEKALVAATPVQPGQQVVLICGFPVQAGRPANLALLHTVGEGIIPSADASASLPAGLPS
ncbi:MAG: pyruvate kinase [Chloroflexi bacterium]|nr:pyruvate kinase [Chloroflexota bacterium]